MGGLLNATFGNAAELIIALAALSAGLHDVVKASIAGSIVGNILLVLGAAMLAGGVRHSEQHFNASGARSQATLLTLAAFALILPAAYKSAVGTRFPEGLGYFSVSISVVRRICAVLGVLVNHAQVAVCGLLRTRRSSVLFYTWRPHILNLVITCLIRELYE